MAIKKQMLLKSNLGDDQNVLCYIRVKLAVALKQSVLCQYDILRDGSDYVIESKQFNFSADVSPEALNVWSQCYVALKKLPEFAGAIDC